MKVFWWLVEKFDDRNNTPMAAAILFGALLMALTMMLSIANDSVKEAEQRDSWARMVDADFQNLIVRSKICNTYEDWVIQYIIREGKWPHLSMDPYCKEVREELEAL